jgi:FMN phosphatase YigB (HAD superfamily)
VGDNYFADIQGAEKAHLLPVLIDPKELYPENPWPTIRSIDEILGLLETKTSIA